MPTHPSWWTPTMPDLVQRRDRMANVDRLQTMYVRYKCMPEAQVTQAGWDLATSQRYADQLAAEENQAYLREESLLYNGVAPVSIALHIVDAPAEFAVPVKQDRRLTPNFKVRVEVGFRSRCSFPLTLKVYVITQQEKDSVPEWVPDDFLDPDLPPRKPVTELKGTTVITHHFEGAAELDEQQVEQQRQQQQQLAQQAVQSLMGGDGSGLAGLNWGGGGDTDPQLLEAALQESARNGGMAPSTAAALASAMQMGGAGNPLDVLTSIMTGTASAPMEATGFLSHDFEFSAVELVKPTRMNKVYLVFACSILEQDLMFVVYNVPTVGICRAEQRAKACQKLGVNFSDVNFSGLDFDGSGGGGAPATAAAAAAGGGGGRGGGRDQNGMPQQLQSRKRPASQAGWTSDGLMMGDGVGGGGGELNMAALAAGGDLGALGGMVGMQLDPNLMAGLGSSTAANMGGLGALASLGGGGGGLSMLPQAALLPGGGDAGAAMAAAALTAGAAGGAAALVPPLPATRGALRTLLLQEYEAAGLTRRLSALDLQALELEAGLPASRSDGGAADALVMEQQAWTEFLEQFRDRLKLLRLVANVWNQEDPCIIAGFDMDAVGAAQALALQPAGTALCCFGAEQQGSLLLTVKQPPPDAAAANNAAAAAGSNGSADVSGTAPDGMLLAVLSVDDLQQRRLETWLRDLGAATHVLDVYRNRRTDKRVVLGSHKFTRLRVMDPLDAYDDLLV